jgi:hypothetical protein
MGSVPTDLLCLCRSARFACAMGRIASAKAELCTLVLAEPFGTAGIEFYEIVIGWVDCGKIRNLV